MKPNATNTLTLREILSGSYPEQTVRHWLSSQPRSTILELRKSIPVALRLKQAQEKAQRAKLDSIWKAQEGPQTQALKSEADILFYGGAAGGGKTDLLLGAARIAHTRSIIFRRVFPSLRAIIDRSRSIYNQSGVSAADDSYNESLYRWRFADKCQIKFGSIQYEKNVTDYQGQPYDLYGFDEITEFSETMFRFVTGWNRTTKKGQRCRIICTGNPPTSAEGDWVISFFAPWLDPMYPRPARPGDLRWFTTIAGKDLEVPDNRPFVLSDSEPDGRKYDFDPLEYDPTQIMRPLSRTFIPAKVTDNKYLKDSGYIAKLQAFPEPLRSKMLFGDFAAGRQDDAWQVIPTDWIIKAQARWRPDGHNGQPMDALGVDVARGGKDQTVLTPRHGVWFGRQVAEPGKETPDGFAVIQLIAKTLNSSPVKSPEGHQTAINMDTIAVGSSPQDIGKMHGLKIVPCIGSGKSEGRDRTRQFGFVNLRAEWIWNLREALDPDLGENLAIPPDRMLAADLTSVRWKLTPRGIQCEAKEDIIKRIGRSPDNGDSLIYSYAQTQTIAQAWLGWVKEQAEAKAAGREN